MSVDFVSDVTCPWCAIGFTALERGIERLGGEVTIELHLQPSELNPGMPAEGEDIVRYMARRYGRTAEAVAERQAEIGGRGAEVGFSFGPPTRTWTTFNAHRLLHWAGLVAEVEALASEVDGTLAAAFVGATKRAL
jgi:predicted DsbA family dithiol-disulfide isomerase